MTCNKYEPNKQGFVSANVNIPLNMEKKTTYQTTEFILNVV